MNRFSAHTTRGAFRVWRGHRVNAAQADHAPRASGRYTSGSLADGRADVVSSRALAVGQRRELPGWQVLGTIHPRLQTPINALVFQGLIATVFALFGSFNSLSDLVIFVVWVFFTLGVFGVFILRRRTVRVPGRYTVPLHPAVPLLGLAGGVFLMVATMTEAPRNALLGVGLTLAGLPFYYWSKCNQAAG